jgi:hypothetical protein
VSTRARNSNEFTNAWTKFNGVTGVAVATRSPCMWSPLRCVGGLPDRQSLSGLALRQTLAKCPVLLQCLCSCPSARQVPTRWVHLQRPHFVCLCSSRQLDLEPPLVPPAARTPRAGNFATSAARRDAAGSAVVRVLTSGY